MKLLRALRFLKSFKIRFQPAALILEFMGIPDFAGQLKGEYFQ
jgi:hypothetical protein